MRIIIVLASMGLCATLFWGGTALVGLLMHGLTAHPLVAKAMAGLPVLVLPFVAVLVACQQRRQGPAWRRLNERGDRLVVGTGIAGGSMDKLIPAHNLLVSSLVARHPPC